MKFEVIFQGYSFFFVLRNEDGLPKANGGKHWMRFLPNHVYCFVPSVSIGEGVLRMSKSMPDDVKQFKYCLEIKPVKSLLVRIINLNNNN